MGNLLGFYLSEKYRWLVGYVVDGRGRCRAGGRYGLSMWGNEIIN